jgi:N-acetylneuraminic acid mutarotase
LPNAVANGLTATLAGKVYVLYGDCLSGCIGGSNLAYDLYRYDASIHTWTRRSNVPHNHVGGAGGVINGRWYVAGGGNIKYGQRYLDVYDPATNTWTHESIDADGRIPGQSRRPRRQALRHWQPNAGVRPCDE